MKYTYICNKCHSRYEEQYDAVTCCDPIVEIAIEPQELPAITHALLTYVENHAGRDEAITVSGVGIVPLKDIRNIVNLLLKAGESLNEHSK